MGDPDTGVFSMSSLPPSAVWRRSQSYVERSQQNPHLLAEKNDLSFPVDSLGFSLYSIMSSARSDGVLLPNLDAFSFFSCLIAVARTSALCGTEVAGGAPSSGSWSWRKNIQFFTIGFDISHGFVTYGLYHVEVCSP